MKVGEFRKLLEGMNDNLEVIVRMQHQDEKGEDCWGMGGIVAVNVECGCTDVDACMIDACEDEIENTDDDEDDEDDEDESQAAGEPS